MDVHLSFSGKSHAKIHQLHDSFIDKEYNKYVTLKSEELKSAIDRYVDMYWDNIFNWRLSGA